jgi:hypothetical protein
MQRSMYGKCLLSAVCSLILADCAKHKLTPLGTPLSPPSTTRVPGGSPPALSESRAPQPEKKVIQAKGAAPEVNRLLLDPPRMSFSAGSNAPKKDVQKIDKITLLVDTGEGTLRPESEATIQIALKTLADQLLFVCPDHMRVGTAEDCRFAIKGALDDLFRGQLLALGVSASQAAAVTILVHADLTSQDKNAFDIHAVAANKPSSTEQLWRIVPRNSGDHKLELSVTPSARIVAAGDVQGVPVLLVHSISVNGGENFFNEYWPAMIGCLAALGLFAWIAWTLWRNARPSAFSSR